MCWKAETNKCINNIYHITQTYQALCRQELLAHQVHNASTLESTGKKAAHVQFISHLFLLQKRNYQYIVHHVLERSEKYYIQFLRK